MKLLTIFCIAAAAVSAEPIIQVELVNAGNPLVVAPSVTINGNTVSDVAIGPYTMLMNGKDVPALCIDFVDDSSLNTPWNAYVTPVGSSDLSDTYHPTFGQEYEEATYLYSQILQPGSDRTGLQVAAWDIMTYGITDSSYTSLIGDNSYIDAALDNYNTMDFTGYEILSDTTAHGQQEFLVATPEPGSLLLLGAGLIAAGVWGRRRRAARA